MEFPDVSHRAEWEMGRRSESHMITLHGMGVKHESFGRWKSNMVKILRSMNNSPFPIPFYLQVLPPLSISTERKRIRYRLIYFSNISSRLL